MEISRQTRIFVGSPGEPTKTVSTKIPISLVSRLDSVQRQTGHTRSDLVRLGLEKFLDDLTVKGDAS